MTHLLIDTKDRTPENAISELLALMWYPATHEHNPRIVGYIRDEDNKIEVTSALVQAVASDWANDEHEKINNRCNVIRDPDERYDHRKKGARVNHMYSRITHDLEITRITSPTTQATGWRLTLKKTATPRYSIRTGRRLN